LSNVVTHVPYHKLDMHFQHLLKSLHTFRSIYILSVFHKKDNVSTETTVWNVRWY